MKSLAVSAVASQLVKPSVSPPYPIPILRSCRLDLVIANVYMKTVHFYKHNGSPSFFSSDVLTQALSQALSLYYPMAGTLTAEKDIECNGKGALIVQAIAHCTLADLDDCAPHPRLLQLVPATDPSPEVTSQPLVLIQITRFECGGVALGVVIKHYVADGFSALGFLEAWATIARGEALPKLPSFDKTWLRGRCPPTPQFTHDEYLNLPKPISMTKEELGAADQPGCETVTRVFELPKEFLQRMRHEVGSAAGLTTYEMMAAHVWRCCCEARALRDDEESMLVMVLDGRARLRSSGAEGHAARYVGNVIFNSLVSLTVAEIGGSSVGALGKRVKAALRRLDSAYCQSAIDFLETCPQQQLQSFVKGPHTFASPNMGFISWATLPFDEIDFGWGSAFHAGIPNMPGAGVAYLLRAPATGALRLCIALQRRHMPRFAHLLFDLSSS